MMTISITLTIDREFFSMLYEVYKKSERKLHNKRPEQAQQ